MQAKALAVLSNAAPPDDAHLTSILRLHIEPWFGDFISWHVFANADETSFLLRNTIWQRSFDAQRFTQPMMGLKHGWHIVPTMNVTLRIIATASLQSLLAEARSMPAPDPKAKKGITLDGMPCSLHVAGAFDGNEYAWNAIAVSQEWALLSAWVERLLVVLGDD